MKKLLLLVLSLVISVQSAAAWPSVQEATDEATWETATVAYGSITGSYASLLANGSAHKWRFCDIYNGTDAAMLFDNGTTAIVALPALSGFALDLAGNGRDIRTAIRIK